MKTSIHHLILFLILVAVTGCASVRNKTIDPEATYAKKADKIAAFTETGLESIPDTTWWTGTLLKTMKMHQPRLAYVLVWRNDVRSPTHYYAPFPGQVSVPDFLEFYRDEYTLFEEDLDRIYTKKVK